MAKNSERFDLRLSAEQLAEIKHAASELGITTAELLRRGSLHYYRQRIAMKRSHANSQRREQDPQS